MSLVLVANRAPIRPTADGWAPSLGGLASALLPVLEARGGAWVAMRGPDEETPLTQGYPDEAPAFTVRRVPLEEPEYEAFYQGMANRVLWPLSHYLVEYVEPDRGFRDAYRAVNRRFAHAALDVARAAGETDPTFWVQDYHMMLVPETLRAGMPDARIGFFWHVPWPASEVFRILPSARDLIRGMLGSDLIGFHTEGYAENFRESARDLLGATIEGETVVLDGHRCRAESHPIGIDVARFEGLAMAPEAAEERRRAAYFGPDHGLVEVDVVARAGLGDGSRAGPLIIEEYDASFWCRLRPEPRWMKQVISQLLFIPKRWSLASSYLAATGKIRHNSYSLSLGSAFAHSPTG